jgi:hypothetical protein
MGSERTGIAINEAVFLLSQADPAKLVSLREKFPELDEELQEGIYAGSKQGDRATQDSYLVQKAEVVATALESVSDQADAAMRRVRVSIQRARSRRLISQVLVVIGSSSLLGAVALEGRTVTVISAVLTLLAALGNLFAEYHEKLLNPQASNIYEAFQKLGQGTYRARALLAQLQLAMRHEEGVQMLTDLVSTANELCEDLNGWLIQVLHQFPGRAKHWTGNGIANQA